MESPQTYGYRRSRLRQRHWKRVDLATHRINKGIPGVYVLYATGGAVLYVGHSVDIADRLRVHDKRFTVAFAKICVLPKKHDRMTLERRLIFRLRPSGNSQLPMGRGVSPAAYARCR